MSSRVASSPSPFRDAVEQECQRYENRQRGEKGAVEFVSVGSTILELNQLNRGSDPTRLVENTLSSSTDNQGLVTDLFIELFVTRNARGGKGERMLSYQMWFAIHKSYPATALQMIPLFVHYGYWKDLLQLCALAKANKMNQEENEEASFSTSTIIEACLLEMKRQFLKDIEAMKDYEDRVKATSDEKEKKQLLKDGPDISLLAKWLPRESSEFDKKLDFVSMFSKLVWSTTMDPASTSSLKAKYRKTTSKLTSYLELPEVLLSIQRSDEMNFHKLASKATKNLTRAMLNETKGGTTRRPNDAKRIKLGEMFLEHIIQKGLKGAQVSPHEFVREIMNVPKRLSPKQELALDAQWKDMVKSVVTAVQEKAEQEKAEQEGVGGDQFNPTHMTPLTDVSGSMYGVPMEVSIAMGIIVSEITHPAFQNMVLTFETHPQWHMLNPKDTIVKKVQSLAEAPWGGSTNFAAAFDKILQVCETNRLSYEDMPSLIVFSDMQFDVADPTSSDTMFERMQKKLATTAAKLGWTETELKPIVFWNLRDTPGHPVTKDTEGAVLLSGFSPSLLKMVMYGDALADTEVEVIDEDGTTTRTEKVRVTPEQVLRKILDDPLYDPVREVLVKSKEGVFANNDSPVSPVVVGDDPMIATTIEDDFEMIHEL